MFIADNSRADDTELTCEGTGTAAGLPQIMTGQSLGRSMLCSFLIPSDLGDPFRPFFRQPLSPILFLAEFQLKKELVAYLNGVAFQQEDIRVAVIDLGLAADKIDLRLIEQGQDHSLDVFFIHAHEITVGKQGQDLANFLKKRCNVVVQG